MPVSKNKRKSKRGQNRKQARTRAGSNPSFAGEVSAPDYLLPMIPLHETPGIRPVGTAIGGTPRYRLMSPHDPAQSETEQIDAIIERFVTFEMTEAHYDSIGLREIDLDGEMGVGDILEPMIATVPVDPMAVFDGHPRWTTGQELIDFLDSDPNVFRDEFDGNRWQGSGARWDECPPSVIDCPYRVTVESTGKTPGCVQCETELRPEEVHFHIMDSGNVLTMCGECWSKGPLPAEGRTLGTNFQVRG